MSAYTRILTRQPITVSFAAKALVSERAICTARSIFQCHACPYMPILFTRKAFSMKKLDHGDKSVCHASAIRKAARRLSQMYDTALAPAGLTITQYGLLTELLRRGETAPTVTGLAEAMAMGRSGVGQSL